ncbi:MAG: hypothetical protein HQ517_02955 [SAR324 cluster bacterium]|nr:hypothetical protein [SAR324 cluster bacterium]
MGINLYRSDRFKIWLLLAGLMSIPFSLRAEYRAYLIEVYDHVANKKWEERTGFSPDKYVLTHGGGNRLSVFTKATWVCYGDTSGYTPACPMPEPIKPKFRVGDQVKIMLEKHITQYWVGVVELAYYQKGVKSNVYGVRFGDKRQMFNRYFEFDLVKTGDTKTIQNPQTNTAEATGTTQ